MELVKRCNDPVIALLIILLAFYVRFTLQEINRITIFTSKPKENQTSPALKISAATCGESSVLEKNKPFRLCARALRQAAENALADGFKELDK